MVVLLDGRYRQNRESARGLSLDDGSRLEGPPAPESASSAAGRRPPVGPPAQLLQVRPQQVKAWWRQGAALTLGVAVSLALA